MPLSRSATYSISHLAPRRFEQSANSNNAVSESSHSFGDDAVAFISDRLLHPRDATRSTVLAAG